MTTSPGHLYRPQAQIIHLVNDRFLGLYSVDELPSYYRPTTAATALAGRLIERVLTEGDAELVFGGFRRNLNIRNREVELDPGLRLVIGPEDLREQLGDLPAPKWFLWDRGPIEEASYKEGINLDG